jgi:ankyrin repeat protein
MTTPTLFISYRRDDSVGQAGRLFDRLAERFGSKQVFRDIDTVAAGEDFVQVVRERIRRCDVLLVLIGMRWLNATDEDGRWRLADESDMVRVEIVGALERNLRVIPVLLQGAAMPKAKDLPAELAALARRNAVEIRDTSFDRDVDHLIELLGPSWRHGLARLFQRRGVQAALAAALALGVGLWAYPLIALTPDKARIQIVQMGMRFDADTFVARATEGDLQAVKLFLRAGLVVDSVDRNGATASQGAAASDHRQVLQALLDKGADPGKALVWAAGHGRREMVGLLLARQPARASIGQAMCNAAGTQHTDIVKTLLEAGADINAICSRYKNSALIAAAAVPIPATVRLLLERGADVNAKDASGNTALLAASTPRTWNAEADEVARRLQVVRALLDKGADIEARLQSMQTWQPTALLQAIDGHLAPVAQLLIERGADVNAQTGDTGGDQRNLSALMRAAREGLADVVGALLTKGAAVDARNQVGNTALMEAALNFQRSNPVPEVARVLLAGGADVNAANIELHTALMFAARSRYYVDIDFVRHLLDHGARLNAVDQSGKTALMLAAESGQHEIARELIGRGANLSQTDHDGQSALMIATKAGNKKLAALLTPAALPHRKPSTASRR